MAKDLFKKTLYTNKSINYLKGTIREYDMKDAGFSIIKNDELLPLDKIAYLASLSKYDRKIQIGLYMRGDKALNMKITMGFDKYRELFIKENNIPDSHILSIKKDAIFIINMAVMKDTFGYVKFAMKNRYTSYYYINKVEFYFNSMTGAIDIKNIHDSKLKIHRKYMMKFFKDVFQQIELGNKEHTVLYVKKFADKYRKLELPAGYYREFNEVGEFRFKVAIANSGYSIRGFKEGISLHDIDTTYNYTNYILNIAKIVYK